MRLRLFILIVLASVFAASAAAAAPICLDRGGGMIRCGAPGAMPVGWQVPRAERLARDVDAGSELDGRGVFGLICFVGGLFALFAVLPDFEQAWDGQEGDERAE